MSEEAVPAAAAVPPAAAPPAVEAVAAAAAPAETTSPEPNTNTNNTNNTNNTEAASADAVGERDAGANEDEDEDTAEDKANKIYEKPLEPLPASGMPTSLRSPRPPEEQSSDAAVITLAQRPSPDARAAAADGSPMAEGEAGRVPPPAPPPGGLKPAGAAGAAAAAAAVANKRRAQQDLKIDLPTAQAMKKTSERLPTPGVYGGKGLDSVPLEPGLSVPRVDHKHGHVFIVHADLRKLRCDEWLIPCGLVREGKRVRNQHWLPEPPQAAHVVAPDPGTPRVGFVAGWPTDRPRPWFVHTGGGYGIGRSSTGPKWFSEGVVQFLAAVDAKIKEEKRKPLDRRTRHLLAMPIVGTGAGGGRHAFGAILQAILEVMYAGAAKYGYDLALVTNEKPAFAAAQQIRIGLYDPDFYEEEIVETVREEPSGTNGSEDDEGEPVQDSAASAVAASAASQDDGGGGAWRGRGGRGGHGRRGRRGGRGGGRSGRDQGKSKKKHKPRGVDAIGPFSILTTELLESGKRLSREAMNDRIVLFLGAGVSMGAGLPGWASLLKDLEKAAGFSEAETKVLHETLGFLDRAAMVERRLGREKMQKLIVESLRGNHHSLQHALLNQLPCREVITTNYDTLFEDAANAVANSRADSIKVLPYETRKQTPRWLLKMHGCINHPEDIVLTREDYIRYDQHSSGLAGIVQASLITKSLLFVGFGLRDENMFKCVSAVRAATAKDDMFGKTRGGSAPYYGTALTLRENAIEKEMWNGELQIVPMKESTADSGEAARTLEIFLDYLSSLTLATSHHLLDRKFDAVLSRGERALRDSLTGFLDMLPDSTKETGAFLRLSTFLVNEFGASHHHFRNDKQMLEVLRTVKSGQQELCLDEDQQAILRGDDRNPFASRPKIARDRVPVEGTRPAGADKVTFGKVQTIGTSGESTTDDRIEAAAASRSTEGAHEDADDTSGVDNGPGFSPSACANQ